MREQFAHIDTRFTGIDGRLEGLEESIDGLARSTAAEFQAVRSEMREGFENVTAHIVRVDTKLQNQIDRQAEEKADRKEVSQIAAQVRNFQR